MKIEIFQRILNFSKTGGKSETEGKWIMVSGDGRPWAGPNCPAHISTQPPAEPRTRVAIWPILMFHTMINWHGACEIAS